MNVRRFFKVECHSKLFSCKAFLWCVPILLIAAALGSENDGHSELIRDIENHLIAPCCWTQPISEHESAVSEQMREEVRAMVGSGMSREAILENFVAQYGERVLATPRPEGFNRLVYILPWVALFLGAAIVFILLKKMRTPAAGLSPEPLLDSRYDSVIEKELKDLDEQ